MARPCCSANTQGHIATVQAALRHILSNWNAPEFFSGDASNANYALTLIARAKFSLKATAEQEYYRRRFLRTAAIVIRHAIAAGRLPENTLRQARLQMTPPAVAIANPLQDEQIRQIQHAAGILSTQTWRLKAGLDDEQEEANLEEQRERAVRGEDRREIGE